ncbi:GAF domain-containing protein [Phormidium tenue FACHB-886]|nr:GAF domain-containing protein [Phormidium tenue FACHB-886]
MLRRLIPFPWHPSPALHSPEQLPTFAPLVLGLSFGLVGLSVVAAVPFLLPPIVFAVCLLLPRTGFETVVNGILRAIGSGAMCAGALSLFFLPDVDSGLLRHVIALGAVVLVSPAIRQQLLTQEWQWASDKLLAALTQDQTAKDPEQAIAHALTSLKAYTRADIAIVLRQLDGVTAEALLCLPTSALPSKLTTPALFAEAIDQHRCLYYHNYPATPYAAPVLLGQGIQSLIVLPLQQTGLQGAILLGWRQATHWSEPLKQFVESLGSGLSNLLRFQDVTLSLEKLQARFVAMLETVPQGVVFVDESGELGWVNQTAAVQLGLSSGELSENGLARGGAVEPMAIAQAMTALRKNADNAQELAAQAAQFFSQPQIEIRDWQWCFSQPTKVLSLSSTPIQLRSVPGRLWVIDDITLRKQAEAALRKSEERFQLIARTTNDAVWDWNLLTDQVWWNEGIETLFGYSMQNIGNDAGWWYDNIHPDDREWVSATIRSVIDQGEYWSGEYRYRRADGSYAHVADRGYVIHAPDGKPIRMLGGMTDISDRKQAQEALQLQNQRTQLFAEVTLKIRQSLQLQEILQTAVTEVRQILNADRVLVYRLWTNGMGSGVAEDVLPGFPSVLGQTFPQEVFPPESARLYTKGRIGTLTDVEGDKAIPSCLVGYLRQFKVQAKLVVPIMAKEELWGLLIAHQCSQPRQWQDAEAELLKQLADQIGIALTQAQLLEQEIRQRQELARSNTELQQFAYIASHDLQEPLRMVTSYLQLLERRYKGKLDADADDFINFAVDGAIRMKTLITDLLLYSRVGTHGKAFEHIDSRLAVERALANLTLAIEESGATVLYDALPEVTADLSQLTQLFQNLISNAIKFRGEAPPIIQIAAQTHDQSWLFSVQDNGIGIEPQYAERIFVIFQRLHNRSEYPGTGIGLALCKKIVERHGGKIWIQSDPPQGTTFYFTLPKTGELDYDL